MPQDASEIVRSSYDNVLVLGEPHVGKSRSVVVSACEAFGPGYVINCGKQSGLDPAARQTRKFKWDRVRDEPQMENAVKEARRGSKENDYKWIVLDDYNIYASYLEEALADQTRNAKGEADGRRYWREYKKRLCNTLLRLFDCKAHVYCITHYIETGGGEIEGQSEKTGRGVAPLFAGSARKEIPAMFADVILMGFNGDNERVFFINPEGVYGPSCASLDGTREIPADVGALHKAFIEQRSAKSGGKLQRVK